MRVHVSDRREQSLCSTEPLFFSHENPRTDRLSIIVFCFDSPFTRHAAQCRSEFGNAMQTGQRYESFGANKLPDQVNFENAVKAQVELHCALISEEISQPNAQGERNWNINVEKYTWMSAFVAKRLIIIGKKLRRVLRHNNCNNNASQRKHEWISKEFRWEQWILKWNNCGASKQLRRKKKTDWKISTVQMV